MTDSAALKDMFVPLLGLVSAVVVTIGAVLTAIFGPVKKLRLPVESVPGLSRGLLNLVLFAPFLICFVFVRPESARLTLIGALIPLVLAFFCYQRYGRQLALYGYTKPRAAKLLWLFQRIKEDIVIGGKRLMPDAERRLRDKGGSLQALLAQAEYKPDEIWTRDSRFVEQSSLERWYYGFMLSALVAIVLAAFATTAILSDEAPLVSAKRVWERVTSAG